MLEARQSAADNYFSLPEEVSLLYTKYSNANKLDASKVVFGKDNDSSYDTSNDDYQDFVHRLDELERGLGLIKIGSKIEKIFLPDKYSKKGIVISSMDDALSSYSDILKSCWDKNKLDFSEDKYLALVSAFFQTGIFIYIPKNEVLDIPIRIINSMPKSGLSSISRSLFFSEKNSKASIVQELYSPKISDNENSRQQTLFELVECHVNDNSNLEMVTFQALDKNAINFSNRKAFVERDAKISWYLGLLGANLSRYKIDSIMKGQGSSAEDLEIIFGMDNQSFDVTSNLIHVNKNTKGRVLVKSVMKDTSQSLFKGMIKITKEGQLTESYLAGHAILLDKGAKSDAIPGLEIEANEVKATHSASVTQLDETQLFYLMCRGLTKELAQREIVNGFLEPLSRRMGPDIRAYINYLIENKWNNKPLLLKTDEAMEQILEVEKTRYREVEDIFEKHYKYR